MLTLKKAENLLKIACEEYPSLYRELIFIEEGENFCMTEAFDMYNITIQNKIENDKHTKWMYKYLKKQYNLDANIYMFYDFIEVFAFLHEVGHLYYKNMITPATVEANYKEYKEKVYKSYEEAWEQYRNIATEKMADEFAVNIIKNNVLDIWSIMNEIDKEKAKEEYEFWSMEE